MASDSVDLTGEFYPIERLLVCGPLTDALAIGARARAAGHQVSLLIPDEEVEQAPQNFPVLNSESVIGEDDFDLAIELHCTDLGAKAETLLYLEDVFNEQVPILTLTMAISTGELVREMLMPERVIGVSMLPPFAETKVAELMTAPDTTREALHTARRFCESLGMTAVHVEDAPAGVLVRAVCCLVNEAALALQERIATAAEIDSAMKLGVNYPAGPLAWGDQIGLDRVVAVMDGLFAEFKEERYRPVPLLKRQVRAGRTGVLVGQGFHTYR
ncbi:3-hydroxybutyryl-CoA dehydrogenase [candidate division KSB1 bacterium]|nr:3-hydroxybutyryl-CoA dehydrogenase [candidate division KSB1 bacterium]